MRIEETMIIYLFDAFLGLGLINIDFWNLKTSFHWIASIQIISHLEIKISKLSLNSEIKIGKLSSWQIFFKIYNDLFSLYNFVLFVLFISFLFFFFQTCLIFGNTSGAMRKRKLKKHKLWSAIGWSISYTLDNCFLQKENLVILI